MKKKTDDNCYVSDTVDISSEILTLKAAVVMVTIMLIVMLLLLLTTTIIMILFL